MLYDLLSYSMCICNMYVCIYFDVLSKNKIENKICKTFSYKVFCTKVKNKNKKLKLDEIHLKVNNIINSYI